MKKFIIAFTTAVTLISTSAFAGGKEKINPAAPTFEREFKGAQDVKWNEGKDAITASFVINSFRVEAYFSYSGELIGTARNILFNQLPLAAIKEVNNRFGSNAVYEITEYTSGSDTFYDMTVELSTKKLKVRVTPTGEVSVLRKIKNK